MKPDAAIGREPSPDRFGTTRWSVILSCTADKDSEKEKTRRALEELCRIYWRPIFAFICRRGYPVSDAQDLTQDFFVMVLEGNLLNLVDPARGRFRSLLLEALRRFLKDASVSRRAQKRGGKVQFVSWDDWMAEAPSRLSIPQQALENLPPERLFDVRWAATVVERALRGLAEECESHGRRRVFDALSASLAAERADVHYVDLAKSLGISEASVKRLLHEMRERYRALLRQEVADTVEKPDSIDDEVRYLCAALAAA
ncbi:MAG: RNA polymerase subunit sigma-24 [Verrucomicrobia bacterium]|nr:MAG: RNA polymerase subunit sigma-24 [Verrucomicrobiota bacterium]